MSQNSLRLRTLLLLFCGLFAACAPAGDSGVATPSAEQAATVTALGQDVLEVDPVEDDSLVVTPHRLDFPATRQRIDLGPTDVHDIDPRGDPEREGGLVVTVRNTSAVPVTVTDLEIVGNDTDDWIVELAGGGGVPFLLAPAAEQDVEVYFEPGRRGDRSARLYVRNDLASGWEVFVTLHGQCTGPIGDDIRIQVGAGEFTDGAGVDWTQDYGAQGGSTTVVGGDIEGTDDDALYANQRRGPSFSYALGVAEPSFYAVTLHFAETEAEALGARIFDVFLEETKVIDGLDVFGAAGARTAYTVELGVVVEDGVLDMRLEGVVDEASLAAVEVVSKPMVIATPTTLDFGAVSTGGSDVLPLTITNEGLGELVIERLRFLLGGSGNGESFSLDLDGMIYAGGRTNVTHELGLTLAPGESREIDVTFAPLEEQFDTIVLRFEGDFGQRNVVARGLGGHEGDPYLHVVINAPGFVVDYDGNGVESLVLDGTSSHTHEPGRALVSFAWTEAALLLSSSPLALPNLGLGSHEIKLEIGDDSVPQRFLDDTVAVDVLGTDEVPGVLVHYYDASGSSAGALLDAVPTNADYAEVVASPSVTGTTAVGRSPYGGDVMVRMNFGYAVTTAGLFEFIVSGGADHRIELEGLPISGQQSLAVGVHELEVRFAVDDLGDLPLGVAVQVDGGATEPIDAADLTHDETGLLPVINTMPGVGATVGGNFVEISGQGFFPKDSVVVHFGAVNLDEDDFLSWSPTKLELLSPGGIPGTVQVTVETPAGESNARDYVYDANGPVPIDFDPGTPVTGVPSPTTGVWGPDGNFYVASLDGRVTRIVFDDSYGVVSKTTFPGVSGLSNNNVLGIATHPYDPATPVRLYLSHGKHFLNGGGSFSAPSPYTGMISYVEGPGFNTPVTVVSGLPTSNHDHGMNGLVFDNNGDLLVAVGSNTNAGVKHPNSGDLVESPLSAAILKVHLSRAGFNGSVTYLDSLSGLPDNDQVSGEGVDVAANIDVSVHAAGLRNPYDLLLTTGGLLYATDNGPNTDFGAASTGASSEAPDPYDFDELNLIEYGNYYGHPNRSRGRTDVRQNVFRGVSSGPSIPDVFTQAITGFAPSTDGLDEFRSDVFRGQLRGNLIAQKWVGTVRLLALEADGRHVDQTSEISPYTGALSVRMGPGGALLGMDFGNNSVVVLKPNDPSPTGVEVHDITPWRAPATGGTRFVIGGANFGTLANTSVTIGGLPASLQSVSTTRIVGFVPADATPTTDLLDVAVTVQGNVDTLAGAFRYLLGVGAEPGRWSALAPLPVALGEVAAGVINGILYVVGEGAQATYRYDLLARAWMSNRAPRIFAGHHHAAEVIDGKLYLIGGLGAGSEGRVQIYDPGSNSWSQGQQMPWAGGALQTAVIGGKIHAAGGIVGASTVANHSVYDPVANTWSGRTPLPAGRNHGASATDGERFYVFGGRTAGNFVTNGFDDLQIYDPATNLWEATSQPGSMLLPLPEARGGMGKAVWFKGEFYVFGGETQNDPDAGPGNVYARVDVYNPTTNEWRSEKPMLSPRHGIFPVLFQGHMFLPGGGTASGSGQSAIFDTFTRQ